MLGRRFGVSGDSTGTEVASGMWVTAGAEHHLVSSCWYLRSLPLVLCVVVYPVVLIPLCPVGVPRVPCLRFSMGISVWIVTGDNRATAEAVAATVGVGRGKVMAGVLPADKARKVRACLVSLGSIVLCACLCRVYPQRSMLGPGFVRHWIAVERWYSREGVSRASRSVRQRSQC